MGERYDAYFRQRLARFSTEWVASTVPFAEEAERIVVEGMQRLDLPPYTIKPEANSATRSEVTALRERLTRDEALMKRIVRRHHDHHW